MGSFPQCPDFFGFLPGMKCLMRDGEGNKLREVFGFGILSARP